MFFCQHSSLHLPTALRSPTFCSLHVPTVRACSSSKMSNWEKCSRKQKSFYRWCTAKFIHGAKAALTCQLFAFFNFKKLVKNGLQNSLISFCNCKFICKCLNAGNLSSSASSLHSSLISLSMQMKYLNISTLLSWLVTTCQCHHPALYFLPMCLQVDQSHLPVEPC